MRSSSFTGVSSSLFFWSILASAVLAPLSGCVTTEDVRCPHDFTGPVSTAYGDASLDGLFSATGRMSVAARELDAEVRGACNGIAADLGAATNDDVAIACDNASAAIRAVLEENPATLRVEVIPPFCTVDVDAYVDCVGGCDASFDASVTPPRCEGGMLSGGCSGQCSGRCTLEGTVACEAECRGTCSGRCDATIEGSCEGTCRGSCEGECALIGEGGRCEGACEGTCRGECEGTIEAECTGRCEGSCQGECRADIEGSCEGTCTGSCDVAFEAPRCEGGELRVDADVDCRASCDAEASIEAECTPPSVVIHIDDSGAEALVALVETLRAHLPSLLIASERLEIVVSASAELASSLEGATRAASAAGVQASVCLTHAIQAQVQAARSLRITVEASVEVSGTISASAD